MYKKINPDMNFVSRENEVLEFWKEHDVFNKTLEKTKDGEEFSFYDGPPTANGKPHIGHILTRVMKDIIPRFKTMKGYHATRKAGWDTHGLPVELEVEKVLGMDGKQDIEKYGIEPFIQKCKESVWKYTSEWKKMSDRVGYWVDMDNPYITYDDNYIESEWWSLKTIFDKGLIYKGHKIVPYCPRCGTALSSHEVAQGYKDVEEKSAVAAFEVVGRENTYILAWTTTPWTLPSNAALCFNPEYDYAEIDVDGVTYILAKERISAHFEEGKYTILCVKKGSEYKGVKYVPLYENYQGKQNCHIVVCDGYVTLDDGTGVVHIAPAFGEDDARVGRENDIPFIQQVDDRGNMVKGAPFEGTFCKDADKLILNDLKERGLLFSAPVYNHSYPFCWRCDTPLLYYARSTWFISMTKLREQLVKNNDTVNWMPESIGKGRMGNFLENVIDWGLSRERYWGTPLPIWICDDCGETEAIGSKAELKERGGIEGDIELHKPYVDAVTLRCPKCGGVMHRTPEVIDCWYDSGSMPFAQHHYPFENKEIFEKTFPAQFISEAVDQTRGWFYTLLAISTLLFDKAPFKNCIVLGHVNDKNGIKMSKHKGNVVDPWSVLDKQGADAVRWYFYTGSNPWIPSRFYEEAVSEVQRKFLGTLFNTYSFYILYAEIDKFDPTKYNLDECALSTMDKWILSALNSLVKRTDENLEKYAITESAREIAEFVDTLSNWYVRRCRDRYWGSEMTDDKAAAYMTLYTVLETLCRLLAPYVPFITEEIYQNIVRSVDENAPESVHLCSYPVANEKYIDPDLEKGMVLAEKAAVLGRSARNASAVKNRQPLRKIIVCGDGVTAMSDELLAVVRDELNVKEIESLVDAGSYVSYEVKPQLRTLGPKYGKRLNAIRVHLAENAQKIVECLRSSDTYVTDIDGEVSLTRDDLLISVSSKEGYSVTSEAGMTVILDTTLDDELISEGLMREIVSKVQNLRKESGFEVTDHIRLFVEGDGDVEKVIRTYGAEISEDVLADEISLVAPDETESTDVNGKSVKIAVEKL
ncbi:MAG: isoleucine--tRNA ligase [Clostridia bacterium]|nr:isoleucine--tRNA ligase [Clostridia bacterium]